MTRGERNISKKQALRRRVGNEQDLAKRIAVLLNEREVLNEEIQQLSATVQIYIALVERQKSPSGQTHRAA